MIEINDKLGMIVKYANQVLKEKRVTKPGSIWMPFESGRRICPAEGHDYLSGWVNYWISNPVSLVEQC